MPIRYRVTFTVADFARASSMLVLALTLADASDLAHRKLPHALSITVEEEGRA